MTITFVPAHSPQTQASVESLAVQFAAKRQNHIGNHQSVANSADHYARY